MSEERLDRLEMLAAEQERTIETLSGELAKQWETVERLERRLEALARRLVELEERTGADVPVTRPPHW
ncbi:SlyX family protein [Aquibium sp. A9E412]|uniref:SlyX family protein n=1 Tax=Aquibium sp. A9E412 TaxID=2976767 RepID=UPI0025B22789|nr:SlyX family protein [Aquibium sp. A9E412]MDN2566193.1 SlyX family protein [Aquibium sp. A9E412]